MVEFLEDGERKSGEFHRVIISTQLQRPAFLLRKLQEEPLGLKLAQKVEHTEDPSLKPTEREGIAVAGELLLDKRG